VLNDPALLGNLLRGVAALAVMVFAVGAATRLCRDGTTWAIAAGVCFVVFAWLLVGVVPHPHRAGFLYALEWGLFGAGIYAAVQAYRAGPSEPKPATHDPETLLGFWFGDDLSTTDAVAARTALWFEASAEFDRALRERFGDWPDRARRGEFDAWQESARDALALVITLDQLPRNLFRGRPESFAYDERARAVALRALERGLDELVHPIEAAFFYLPLEHAEDLALQQRSVRLFDALADEPQEPHGERLAEYRAYAERHRDVIERFGRFPHRNAVLGRESTPEELRWLAEHGSGFGGDASGARAAGGEERK
jgi:uncharacterized protein (DUF924 family)